MADQENELEQAVRRALADILGELRPLPVPGAPTQPITAGPGNVTEIMVSPDGSVTIRVGGAGSSAAEAVAATAEPEPETPLAPRLPEFDDDPFKKCPNPCECPNPDETTLLASAYFPDRTESLIQDVLSATALSRDQLLSHLVSRLLTTELETFASSLGIETSGDSD